MRLRSILNLVFAGVTTLAIAAAASLVLITTYLHLSTQYMREATQSILITEEMRANLLLYERTRDPFVRASLEGEIRTDLNQLTQHVVDDEEAKKLAQVTHLVTNYLAAPTADIENHAGMLVALDDLVRINVRQADEMQQTANRWDKRANLLALVVAIVLVVSVVPTVYWLNRYGYRPIRKLREAMDALGNGDLSTRLSETGPTEVRVIARQFNGMAETLAAQRQQHFAFIGGIAHDLRSPLSVLKMSMGLLERRRGDEESQRASVQRMQRQVDRLERMVNDLLDATRVESGNLKLAKSRSDLMSVVQEVVAHAQETTTQHTIRIEAREPQLVFAFDQLRMEQVLTNLVSNAVKYSPSGGDVTVRLERTHEQVTIEVSDEGVGLTEEEQRTLFHAFSRVGTSASLAPGIGLGLFVAKRLVEAHGGHIEVESVPGIGSTFRVVLPREGGVTAQEPMQLH